MIYLNKLFEKLRFIQVQKTILIIVVIIKIIKKISNY